MKRSGGNLTNSREPASALSFAQMIERARRRDEEALMMLYQRALPIIYRYVVARLGRPDVVEDVVADVFLVMIESIGDLRAGHEAGFYAWLIQIAQGKIARVLSRQQRNQARLTSLSLSQEGDGESLETALTATDLESNPAELQEWRETLQELGLALGSLTPDQQVVVIGRFLAGQSIEDLARALNKKPGSVRALQFRALETLAERLGLTRWTHSRGRGGQR
ncbi:MAG TPA: sigma-70 family RNA polymerase sigma factor [Ktedonobacterales bacterium]|nr:sigma-70 family RNA polymerase sigma factor [Ktedonobacterales bacterium]